jgi:hypothetical protein
MHSFVQGGLIGVMSAIVFNLPMLQAISGGAFVSSAPNLLTC